MSKKSPQSQSRRHVHIFDEDWDFLERSFGGRISVSQAIRKIVHVRCNELRAKVQHKIDSGQVPITSHSTTVGE